MEATAVSSLRSIVDVPFRVWNCALEQQFEEKHDELRTLMGQLRTHRDSVMARVVAAEAGLLKRTPTVDAWLQSFDDLEKDVADVLQEGSKLLEKCCISAWYPWNCWINQKFGKKVISRLSLVRELRDRGDFQDVAERRTPTQVEEVPEDPNTVGLDSAPTTVWSLLQHDSVGIVGLYGLGGVGKTTLLKKINNMFLTGSFDFDFVIWVVVSKEVRLEGIQKDIGRRLGLSWGDGEDMSSRSRDIFKMLCSKKFVLLLDDLWERLELTMIGIPTPSSENKSKIIFTTRSEIVCGSMEANEKMQVECLNPSQSWDLFQNKVGVICSDPEIQPLAETVAKECGGLPLALTVIGRAMASKKTVREWKDAITTLRKHAANFTGMEKVFAILKYSYDELEDDSVRSCLLFCSLYPEDYKIRIEPLVEQWIGKGYIDDFDEWDEAINTGHRIIGILKSLSLLESVDGGFNNSVKLHDVIRDMAHWIEKDRFLVITDGGFSDSRRAEKLRRARSISVTSPTAFNWLHDKPDCPNVTTLLFCCSPPSVDDGRSIHDDFFLLMPDLKFVDINGITNIPTSIWKLLSLEYLRVELGIVWGSFIKIPCEMRNITRLKYLHLFGKCSIPIGVIGHLSNLRCIHERYIGSNDEQHIDETETYIQDLRNLSELISLRIAIRKVNDLEFILKNQRLLHYTIFLIIQEFEKVNRKIIKLALSPFQPSSSACLSLGYMKRLQCLEIRNCREMDELLLSSMSDETQIPLFKSLEKMVLTDLPKLVVTWENLQSQCFRNLHDIGIYKCHSMVNASWLGLAPNLQNLYIYGCDGLTEIISDASAAREEITFSKLKELKLYRLPNLMSVCANVLPLPSLEDIIVYKCPRLRRLPLKPNNKLRSIQGEQEWFNNIEWENDTFKSAFDNFFNPLHPNFGFMLDIMRDSWSPT